MRYKRVEDQAVTRRDDLLLLQLPLRLLKGCTVGGDDSRLRFELLVASRQFGYDEIALVLANHGGVRTRRPRAQ